MAKKQSFKNRKSEQLPEKQISKENLPEFPDGEALPEDLQAVLRKLPPDQLRALIVTNSKSTSFHGPVPPPDLLKGYNDIIPNGAERILAMAERQAEHRMNLETYAVKKQHEQSSRGQLFGFIIGLVGLGVSGYLSMNGHDWFAGTLATTTIIGLVSVFVIGKRIQSKNLEEKK